MRQVLPKSWGQAGRERLKEETVVFGDTGWEFVTPVGMEYMPPPEWVIRDLVEQNSLTILVAHGNQGKTLFALTRIYDLLADELYYRETGYDSQLGTVLYFTQEGIYSLGARFGAWAEHRGLSEEHKDYIKDKCLFHTHSRSFGHNRKSGAFGEDLDMMVKIVQAVKPSLVVIDPWADYFNPGEENSNDDARGWIKRIRQEIINGNEEIDYPGTSVLVLAHTSKSDKSASRGASALYDGADREYVIKAEFHKEDGVDVNLRSIQVQCTKAKDGGRTGVQFYLCEEVEYEGRPRPVLRPVDRAEMVKDSVKGGSTKKSELYELLLEQGPTKKIQLVEAGWNENTVTKYLQELRKANLVSFDGNTYEYTAVEPEASDPEELE